jgi:hypothetical protein
VRPEVIAGGTIWLVSLELARGNPIGFSINVGSIRRVTRTFIACCKREPFALPHGDYYEKIVRPAIEKTGLQAVRADAEIFGTGKIIDQVWRGINAAKVLVAELSTRNPNVFYELGLAHALNKPVVLVSSNEPDV